MITVTDAVKNIIIRPGRTFTGSMTFGNNTYGVQNMIYEASLAPNSFFAIGEAICATLYVETKASIASVENSTFSAEYTLSGTSFPLGIFIAGKPVKSDNLTSFTAYDRMAKTDAVTYTTTLDFSTAKTAAQVFGDIVGACNFECITTNISDDITFATDVFSGYSCRDALRYLAAYLGMNCYVGTDGKFRMIGYTTVSSSALTVSGSTMDVPDISGETTSIDGLTCITGEETALVTGTNSAHAVSFVCPFMTQERLDALHTAITSSSGPLYQYSIANINQLCGDPRIELGDVITVSHRNTTYSVPVMYLRREFDGGLLVNIMSFDTSDQTGLTLAQKIDIAYKASFDTSKYAQDAAEFTELIRGASGLHRTDVTDAGGGTTYYFHDGTTLENSTFIFTMTSNGFAWTSGINCWNNGSPVWTAGASSTGAAILQALSAYNISADIIDTGEILIYDKSTTPHTLIHKLSYDDRSFQFGGSNGITYSQTGQNANKIVLGSDVLISGDVTIGGLTDIVGDAVEDAVGDLSLNGIDHQVTTYSTSSSNTEPPQIPSGYTSFYTYFFATSSDTYLAPYPSNSSSWKTSPSSAGYNSSNYTTNNLYGCTYYVYSGGTTKSSVTHLLSPKGTLYTGETSTLKLDVWRNTIMSASAGQYLWTRVQTYYTDNPTVVGNTAYSVARQGSNGSSGANVYIKYSANSDGSNMTDTPNENTQYIGVYNGLQATIPSNPSSYSWSKYVGVDGNQVFIRYSANSNGLSMTETPQSNTQYIGIYSGSATSAPTDYGQYRWTKIKGEQGNAGVGIDHTNVTYGIGSSGTSSNGVTFSSTIPDISSNENKGKYLWTKTDIYYTSAPNTVAKTAYSVAYIAGDGQPGTDGVGISSITQYFYPSASDNVNDIPLVGNSSWKTSPSDFTGNNAFSASKPYLWTYTHTAFSNNTSDNTSRYILGVWGQDGSGSGAQGRGISKITPQYYLSTSSSTTTGGSWSDSPQAYSYYPSASGTKSSGSYSDIITDLSLSSGTTYTVKWKYNPSVNYATQLAITNSSNTNIKYINTTANTSSGSFEFTPTSNYSNAKVRIQSVSTSVNYDVTIMGTGLEIKKYYWQRDKIDWDDNSASTYTTPVLISALNKAIWDANEANAAIGLWCYENDVTHIDGGKIYTGTVTADKIVASKALIDALMANSVAVSTGDITITSDDPPDTPDSSYRDQAAYDLFSVSSYSSLNAAQKRQANSRAKYYQSMALSKLCVKNNSYRSFVFPAGLYIYEDGATNDAAIYGRIMRVPGQSMFFSNVYVGNFSDETDSTSLTVTGDTIIGGNLTVAGTINGSGGSGGGGSDIAEKGKISGKFNVVYSDSIVAEISITFNDSTQFPVSSGEPIVLLTAERNGVEFTSAWVSQFGTGYSSGVNYYTSVNVYVSQYDAWYYANGYQNNDSRLPEYSLSYAIIEP